VLRRIVVLTVVVIAVVIALVSASYPSVTVPTVSTQQLASFQTFTSDYQIPYQLPNTSTALTGYSTATAWYPGNFICDPTSNACTPYPTPTATYVYPQSATYTYQVTFSSEATSMFTTEFTFYSSQTSYQTIPAYAAAGLTEFQYGIIAMVIVAALVLCLLFVTVRGKSYASNQAPELGSTGTVRFCQQCGTENQSGGKFCTSCGARLE
jgi:hypothetical protein